MANDNWRTPPEVFAYYDSTFNFDYDVAASKENALCKKHLTQEDNFLCGGLAASAFEVGRYNWCNPPYSIPLPFVKQCIYDSQCYGIGYVMLLNHDMSVEWASLFTNIKCEIHITVASGAKADKTYSNGRMSFIDGEGNAINQNNKGQMIVIIPPFVRDGDPVTKYKALSEVVRLGQLHLMVTGNSEKSKFKAVA